MFSIFGGNKKKQLQKKYEKLLEEARDLQRKGDIQAFALKTEQAENVAKEIEKLDLK